jgi:hypothetical protein
MSPEKPEEVTYEEYEAMRESGVPPTSLQESTNYTVRIRVDKPTKEVFAFDLASRILTLKHLGRFTVVTFAARFETEAKILELGVSQTGLAFDHSGYDGEITDIPYNKERGYFVGERGNPRRPGGILKEDKLEDDKVVVFEQHRELVLAR